MTDTTIITANGPVKGITKTSSLGSEYYSFQKIPYAKPPVGNLRFRDPQPVNNWIEPIDATSQGPACFNINFVTNAAEGDEDCLQINIFTKSITPNKPLPVMVWIHGGAFVSGSSGTEMYGPDFLIEKDVILVSFNYRLGALGFLSLSDPSLNVPGNAGLKDQTLALQWIRTNIAAFGGDSNNITIFGESAGGASVHYHMISDMSKNLFDRAISQSGTSLNNWAFLTSSQEKVTLLAKKLGWTGNNDEKEILDFLRSTDASKIVAAQGDLRSQNEIVQKHAHSLGPVIEPYISEQCFLPKDPMLMSREAWSNSIPLIIGGTSDEGLMAYKEITTDPSVIEKTNFEDLLPRELGLKRGSERSKKLGEEMKNFYFGSKTPNMESLLNYCDVINDKLFWHGIHRAVLSRVNAKNAGPTYLYRFNVETSTFSLMKMMMGKYVKGTCHGDDLTFLFSNDFKMEAEPLSLESKTIERMVGMWTKFATDGNPNPEIISPVKWEPLTVKQAPFKALNISEKLEMIELPESKRFAFLDSMFERDQLY